MIHLAFLKYESDGGPGIVKIMKFLSGSKNSAIDRNVFFRSQILFYLLAAIDGHAKNFSISIEPFGHYCLAPLYDITSAHPLIKKHQLQQKEIKMAMALIGKNKHYRWASIQRRHFISTAAAVSFPREKTEAILIEVLEQIEQVITIVSDKLPTDFPVDIAESIFEGIREGKKRLSV